MWLRRSISQAEATRLEPGTRVLLYNFNILALQQWQVIDQPKPQEGSESQKETNPSKENKRNINVIWWHTFNMCVCHEHQYPYRKLGNGHAVTWEKNLMIIARTFSV